LISTSTKQTKASLSKPAKSLGGRPTRDASEQLREHILEVATKLLLSHGYGATSIEEIAKQARISKRTFYYRFPDKSALMTAVVVRLIDRLRPAEMVSMQVGEGLEEILLRLATLILKAALTPPMLQLHRLIVAESKRFPELAHAVANAGGRQEAEKLISELLVHYTKNATLSTADANFAAQHFLQMIVSIPQMRALSLGNPMESEELSDWTVRTVKLFLGGLNNMTNRLS
jgi:TetR/AcrR family transcriptional regulator, mexJK operon transcriptional repressor